MSKSPMRIRIGTPTPYPKSIMLLCGIALGIMLALSL